MDRNETHEPPQESKAQAFFARLLDETRRPSYGDAQRDFIRNLVLRAQEAGLYEPPRENP